MNSITICGHLGRDPELKYTPSGVACCEFGVADARRPDKDGVEQVQWFNCRAYGQVGEIIAKHFTKGKPIFAQGLLHARLYQKRDGGTGMSLDVQVSAFEFVNIGSSGERKADEPYIPQPAPPREQAAPSGDVPDITDPFADQ